MLGLRWLTRIFFLVAFAEFLSGSSLSLSAQVVELKAGSSSLFQTSGASASFSSGDYRGWLGAGWHDGPVEGFFLSVPMARGFAEFGDQEIPFALPTDIFNSFVYFLGRGAAWRISSANGSFRVFAGFSSQRFGTPFLLTAEPDRFAGAIFFSRPVNSKLVYSLDFVHTGRGTLLQSFAWTPSKSLALAITGGASGSDPYSSASLDFHDTVFDLKASYTQAGDSFRRITVSSPLTTEYDRENIALEFRPLRSLSLNVSRQNLLSPQDNRGPGLQARVTGAGVSFNAFAFRFRASAYRSTSSLNRTDAYMAGVERPITRRFSATADAFHAVAHVGNNVTTYSLGARERLSPRLQLNQVAQFGLNQKTLGFGGSYESNRFSFGSDYQTIYIPFSIPGQSPFRQVAFVHFRFVLPHDTELHAESNVTPVGRVKYTAYASALEYRDGTTPSAGASGLRTKMNDCVVRGRIRDQNGIPIGGVALRIGPDLLFSDSDGIYFGRMRKCGSYPLRLAPEESLVLDAFEIITAPDVVYAVPESTAQDSQISLRRLIR